LDVRCIAKFHDSGVLASFLHLVVCWVNNEIMVLEKLLDSILTNASKVMWENFGSQRNLFWHGWCNAKFHDFGVLA